MFVKSKISLLFLIFLGAAIFFGCGKETAQEVVLDMPDKTYELQVGDRAVIKLEENASTGFSWHYQISNEDVAGFESESIKEPEGNVVGASAEHTWAFKCLNKGESEITFKYYREWEGPDTAEKTLTYFLSVN